MMMSDTSQGPGWWQASDGKWYSPEQASDASAATPAPAGPPPGYGSPAGPPAGYGPPTGAPGPYGAPADGAGQAQLAEWGQRVVATLIDGAIVAAGFVVVFIVALILGAVADVLGFIVLGLGYLAVFVAAFYFYWLTGETGQSPGKRLTGIKVVGEQTGQPIGGGGGILRYFAHIPDGFCLIGYLFPLWDAKKQTFADKLQSTVVISGQPKQSFSAELFKK